MRKMFLVITVLMLLSFTAIIGYGYNLSLDLIGGPEFQVYAAQPYSSTLLEPINGEPINIFGILTNQGTEDFAGFVNMEWQAKIFDVLGNQYPPSSRTFVFGWGSYWAIDPEHVKYDQYGNPYLYLPAGESMNVGMVESFYGIYDFGSNVGGPPSYATAPVGDYIYFYRTLMVFNTDLSNFFGPGNNYKAESDDVYRITVVSEPIPEPGTLLLLGTGLGGLLGLRRKTR